MDDTVTAVQMKEIERRADEAGLSYYQMMENAGVGAVEYVCSHTEVMDKKVYVFCGRGNNGGDGFVAARKLKERGARVTLVLVEGEPKTVDAEKNRNRCREMSIPEVSVSDLSTAEGDLIIDAIYGTGFHGVLKGPGHEAARMINRSKAAVYALDIPSGVNGDTGEADEDSVRADCTIVFHRLKPAHARESCSRYCGRVVCISIGIEEVLKEES